MSKTFPQVWYHPQLRQKVVVVSQANADEASAYGFVFLKEGFA